MSVYLLRGRIMWLLRICSTLVNLKAVIFPHRNYYNNDNNKNNRSDFHYNGDSMISKLILYACLTVKTAIYWNGFSSTAVFLLGGRCCIRGYWLTEVEANCREMEDVAKGGSERASWELQRHNRNSDESINSEEVSLISLWLLGC